MQECMQYDEVKILTLFCYALIIFCSLDSLSGSRGAHIYIDHHIAKNALRSSPWYLIAASVMHDDKQVLL